MRGIIFCWGLIFGLEGGIAFRRADFFKIMCSETTGHYSGIYTYQHPPTGGVESLRDCRIASLTIHLAPLGGSTLPKTNWQFALENRPKPKRKGLSSNHQFSGAFAVSFREGRYIFECNKGVLLLACCPCPCPYHPGLPIISISRCTWCERAELMSNMSRERCEFWSWNSVRKIRPYTLR